MNKSEIKQKRAELVRVILEIEKLKVRKAAITKALAPDFEANEAEYRSGVKTDAGLLLHIKIPPLPLWDGKGGRYSDDCHFFYIIQAKTALPVPISSPEPRSNSMIPSGFKRMRTF